MEEGDEPFLHLRIEVDEEVAADKEVEPGKWGVLDDAVVGEDDHFSETLRHLPAPVKPGEEALEPLFAHLCPDVVGIESGPRLGHGPFVDIGGENLHLSLPAFLCQVLFDQHRDGVRLLAGRTAGVPDPNRLFRVSAGEYLRDDFAPEKFERFRVAEEAGNAYEYILAEGLGLLGVFLEDGEILPDPAGLVNRHPPLNPPQDSVSLVGAEIVAGPGLDESEYGVQFLIEGGGVTCPMGEMTFPPGDFGYLRRDFFHRQDYVRRARGDGVPGHRRVDCRLRFLDQDDPSPLLDPLHPLAAVQPEAGEDNGDGARPAVRGKRGEKAVYRVMRPPRNSSGSSLSLPSFTVNVTPAGITWTVFGQSGMPSSAVSTSMEV